MLLGKSVGVSGRVVTVTVPPSVCVRPTVWAPDLITKSTSSTCSPAGSLSVWVDMDGTEGGWSLGRGWDQEQVPVPH